MTTTGITDFSLPIAIAAGLNILVFAVQFIVTKADKKDGAVMRFFARMDAAALTGEEKKKLRSEMRIFAASSSGKSIEWIDFAKGVAILLVILGHTISGPGRGIIFSFHMPAFFMLSLVTYRLSTSGEELLFKAKKAFKRLIIPTVVIFGLRQIVDILQKMSRQEQIEWLSFLKKIINVFVYGSGVDVDVMGTKIPAMGMMWFLIVLFLSRTLFDYLHLRQSYRKFIVTVVVCSVAGVLIAKVQWLPFSFDIALAILPLLYVGTLIKDFDMNNKPLLRGLICGVIWILTYFICLQATGSYLEFPCRRYAFFPLCYITAIAGTMTLGYLGVIVKDVVLFEPILFIGKYSLYMFCVHAMDYLLTPVWKSHENLYIDGAIRILLDFVAFLILVLIINYINIVKARDNTAVSVVKPAEVKPDKTEKEEEGEKPVIKVEHLCMDFVREKDEASSIKERLIRGLKRQREVISFRALDDISFEIYQGEVIGIIGTNGSGKSTTVKIISGALIPTKGKVYVDRKKVQLLTLGTGFDTELTGKENIYLNGAIIGYPKEFIDEHYDSIVEFAELEGFMDEKVRNYSSGMVQRLGFAIATARDSAQILILDEVFAVGDQFFRKKSEKRIKEMIHGGSTAIIISHSMDIIRKNCDRVIWIEKGHLKMIGAPEEVCSEYANLGKTK